MKWIAYCVDCKRDLTEGGWNNGEMVEAQGTLHQREKGHDVIIGYRKEKVETAEFLRDRDLRTTGQTTRYANE